MSQLSSTLTPRGLTLLGGGVLVWGLGRLLGVSELHVIAATSVALVGVCAVSVVLATATIAARRTITAPKLRFGAPGEVVLDLRNDGRLPSSVLLVEDGCHYVLREGGQAPRFVVPGLGPNRVVSLRYEIQGRARGRYPVGPLRISVQDPFGLTQRTRRYAATDSVLVYPPIETLPPGVVRGRHHGSGSSQQRRLFTSGDEFYTMREYAEGDDLRQVHWPSTAHRQRLMVRQQEQPWQAQATILLDTRRVAHRGTGPDSTFEKAVSAAASLVVHLTERSYQVRLVTEADARGVRAQDREALLERLAEVRPSPLPSLGPALEFVRRGGGLLVAIVAAGTTEPLGESPDVRGLLRAGQGHTSRLAVVASAGPDDDRADRLVALLTASRWTATTVAAHELLAQRWLLLLRGRSLAGRW
jgi:uncharacterized protein (DUF58 family)